MILPMPVDRRSGVTILGIETSCDETSAAVVVDGEHVLSNVIASQIAIHQAYGGVVPELAARGQVTAITPTIRQAVADADIAWSDIDAIAYTQGPGLAGSLIVGVNAAKGLAMSLGIPTVPVHHLEAHVYANWLRPQSEAPRRELALPAICLLVSGGHTELLLVDQTGSFTVLGQTIDDAAGEAFDKGARLLGLGYPGGPAIQKAAEGGDRNRFALPRSDLGGSFDFSFSGLKTALLREVQPYRLDEPAIPPDPGALFPKHRPPRFRDDLPVADLAASFEEAIVFVLAERTVRAAWMHNARTVMLAGGVAANRHLRQAIETRIHDVFAELDPPTLRWPEFSYCTDNAAMVAGLGYRLYAAGVRGGLDADAYPRWPIGEHPRGTGKRT